MVAVYVTLEMLKDGWARERRVPFKAGSFWKKGTKGKAHRYGFRSLLRDMCAEVGMRPRLVELVKYRNALLHSGGIRLAKRSKRRAYVAAQRLAREYMLRRLGYRGPFVLFGDIRSATLR
jgi:hypothetical protein